MDELCAGLTAVKLEDRESIGLRSVGVKSEIRDLVCSTIVEQRYVNDGAKPVEVEYTYPTDSDGLTYSVTAIIGGKRITTRVEEKKKAEKEYDEAIRKQKQAVIVRRPKADISVLGLGNLPPKSECVVEIRQLTVAKMEGPQIRFTLPTVVAPRYDPNPHLNKRLTGESAANRVDAKSLDYKLKASFNLHMSSDIAKITCPSHGEKLKVALNAADKRLATADFGQRELALDKDIVILVDVASPFSSRAQLEYWAELKSHVVQLAFCLPELKPEERTHVGTEVHFVVDCSGSMEECMDQVRKCMTKSLKSMDASQTFNLHRFGDRHKTLWRTPKAYSDKSLKAAEEWVGKLSANLGGTELLPILQTVLERIPPTVGKPRQIMLLTDGEITNTQQVVDLVRRHAHETRMFTIGIGRSVSKHLVQSLARAGNGAAEFVIPGEPDFDKQCLRQTAKLLQPAFIQPQILQPQIATASAAQAAAGMEIEGSKDAKDAKDAKAASVERWVPCSVQWPARGGAMFGGSRHCVYALLSDAEAERVKKAGSVTVSYRSTDDPDFKRQTQVLPLLNGEEQGGVLHRLAAAARIQECENALAGRTAADEELSHTNGLCQDEYESGADDNSDSGDDEGKGMQPAAPGGPKAAERKPGDLMKAEVLELALKYQVPSSLTSFVGVDDTAQVEGATSTGPKPPKHTVPLAAQRNYQTSGSADDDGDFLCKSAGFGGMRSKGMVKKGARAAWSPPRKSKGGSSPSPPRAKSKSCAKSSALPPVVPLSASDNRWQISSLGIVNKDDSDDAEDEEDCEEEEADKCAPASLCRKSDRIETRSLKRSAAPVFRDAAPPPAVKGSRDDKKGAKAAPPVKRHVLRSQEKSKRLAAEMDGDMGMSDESTESAKSFSQGGGGGGGGNPTWTLDELVGGQGADGSWSLPANMSGAEYAQLILVQLSGDLQKAAMGFISKNAAMIAAHEKWFITYLCRLLLRTCFTNKKAEWSMIDAKAGRWLNNYAKTQKSSTFLLPQSIALTLPLPL